MEQWQKMNPDIFEKFSPNLKKALIMAERISREQNMKMDTEHQLQALILLKGTLANDILSMFEVNADRVQLIASLVSKTEKPKPSDGMNKSAKEAIQYSVQFASKYHHSFVDCEHLLLSLISKKQFNSYLIIERMGINPTEIKKQIESIFSEIDKSKKDEGLNIDEMPEPPLNEDGFDLGGMNGMGPIPGMPPTMTMQKKQSALKQFSLDITEMATKNELDPVVGRDNEISRLVQILSRRKKNNPVLIGDPGVGKTAIVEGLAQRIVNGGVPSSIVNKKILSLDMGSLLAGTMYRGQFESRIKSILEEVKKNKDIILFIDEVHTVIGTGSAEGSMDAANILKPSLSRGEVRIIGATTFDEYKKHIEKDPAFERRFQPIIVPEPTEAETLEILKGIKNKYEHHHHVKYTDEAILAAVSLSKRYIQDRFLPDKAIDLIDEAAAATNVITREAAKLSKLKKEYGKIMSEKDDAVGSEQYEKATFLRQKEVTLAAKIAEIEDTEKKNKKIIIDQNDIGAVVSRWTGIPVTNLSISEKKNFLNLEARLEKFVVGQDEAIKSITQAIRRSRIGISDPKRPIGSFIFLGPTGVGKTELVKVLAREIFGKDDALVKIDMSEFMEKHNVSRLVGAPAGYVGYEEGGKLTEIIRRKPYSVILLDEIEKAHPEVFNILLQILEDGELTDAKGRRIDFRNTLIVMTSNLGTNLLTNQAKIGFETPDSKKEEFDNQYKKMKEHVLQTVEKQFRPEFINRLDQIIVFKPLSQKVIRSIVDIELKKLLDRIKSQNLKITISGKAKDKIAELGYKPEFGARPMRKVIIEQIENPLTEALMLEEFKVGDNVKVELVNNIIILRKE